MSAVGQYVGWHVVEVGLRQAWPFLGLADPSSGAEVRLWLDARFSIGPRWPSLDPDHPDALTALSELLMRTCADAATTADGAVALVFDDLELRVAGEPGPTTVGEPWWVSPVAGSVHRHQDETEGHVPAQIPGGD